MTNAYEILGDKVDEVIDLNRAVPRISPNFIAGHVMDLIHFPSSLHEIGYYGCLMHVRQMAREKLRGKYAADRLPDPTQPDLPFDGLLQDRYPIKVKKGEEPIYVRRDLLSEDDRWWNIEALRKTAKSLVRHSDALEAETIELFGNRKPRAA